MRKRHTSFGSELDAILSGTDSSNSSVTSEDEALQLLSITTIRPNPFQPRTIFEPNALAELSQSIQSQGLIQPVVVRQTSDSGYELVVGERRWRAAQAAGMETIPAIVRSMGDREALAIALVENMQREDLNAIDEARALKRLVDEFDLSHSKAGRAVGRSRSAVSNLLRLLELAGSVQKLVEDGKLEMGHARALLALAHEEQVEIALLAVKKKLTARQVERLVSARGQDAKESQPAIHEPDPPVSDQWKSQLSVRYTQNGRPTVTLRQLSADQFHDLIAFLSRE